MKLPQETNRWLSRTPRQENGGSQTPKVGFEPEISNLGNVASAKALLSGNMWTLGD